MIAIGHFAAWRSLLGVVHKNLATGIAKKLMTYGTGRPVTPADRAAVEAVVAETAKSNLSFRAMIHAVVNSDFFLRP